MRAFLKPGRFLEAVVILAIGIMFWHLYFDDPNARLRSEIEQCIFQWKAVHADIAPPTKLGLDSNAKIVGNWKCPPYRGRGFFASLEISPLDKDDYTIRFITGNCGARYETTRNATFNGGVLLLDKPISDAVHRTYDRIFVIESKGSKLLLPAANVNEFELGVEYKALLVFGCDGSNTATDVAARNPCRRSLAEFQASFQNADASRG